MMHRFARPEVVFSVVASQLCSAIVNLSADAETGNEEYLDGLVLVGCADLSHRLLTADLLARPPIIRRRIQCLRVSAQARGQGIPIHACKCFSPPAECDNRDIS
eukprot:1472845-Rhodomonas_salina.2